MHLMLCCWHRPTVQNSCETFPPRSLHVGMLHRTPLPLRKSPSYNHHSPLQWISCLTENKFVKEYFSTTSESTIFQLHLMLVYGAVHRQKRNVLSPHVQTYRTIWKLQPEWYLQLFPMYIIHEKSIFIPLKHNFCTEANECWYSFCVSIQSISIQLPNNTVTFE